MLSTFLIGALAVALTPQLFAPLSDIANALRNAGVQLLCVCVRLRDVMHTKSENTRTIIDNMYTT